MNKKNNAPGNNNTTAAFYALLRAGLWERDTSLSPFAPVDFNALFALALEQNLVGLITAGLEHVTDLDVPYDNKRLFIRHTVTVEQRNQAMGHLAATLIGKMREAGIFAVLVKGQAIAQYYERPLWRASSDIDLFLDRDNYSRAKAFLTPHATSVLPEEAYLLHQPFLFGSWAVELHGLMPTLFSRRINSVVINLQQAMFSSRQVRLWHHNGIAIPTLCPDDDIIIIFTHFLKHFFVGGVGIRQLGDWCRLLWRCRDALDLALLRSRLLKMGVMSEWRAMASYAVLCLGMPPGDMPFYRPSPRQRRLARRISRILLSRGDLGQNSELSRIARSRQRGGNALTVVRRLREFMQAATVFPLDAPRFFLTYMRAKIRHHPTPHH